MVNARDSLLILRAVAGIDASTLIALRGGEMAPKPSGDSRGYGDGRLSFADAVRALRSIAGLESAWP